MQAWLSTILIYYFVSIHISNFAINDGQRVEKCTAYLGFFFSSQGFGSNVALLDRKKITATMGSPRFPDTDPTCQPPFVLDGTNSVRAGGDQRTIACSTSTVGASIGDPTPWIQLDLGEVFTIHEVSIRNSVG